jgi:DNA-binding NarL/FixJ family response regulator
MACAIFSRQTIFVLCVTEKIFMSIKKTVLVVDNSIVIVDRLIPMLENMENIGIVIHAGTYQEAIEMLVEIRPDMILLDINLPDKNGIELLKKIREKDQEVIVIMITNYATPQYSRLCKKLGAQYFFDKSKDFELIADVIEEVY